LIPDHYSYIDPTRIASLVTTTAILVANIRVRFRKFMTGVLLMVLLPPPPNSTGINYASSLDIGLTRLFIWEKGN
jgi:hypothetical protein